MLAAVLARRCLGAERTPVFGDQRDAFTVLTAINICGYDQELDISDPLRAQVRSEVAKRRRIPRGSGRDRSHVLVYRQHQHRKPRTICRTMCRSRSIWGATQVHAKGAGG